MSRRSNGGSGQGGTAAEAAASQPQDARHVHFDAAHANGHRQARVGVSSVIPRSVSDMQRAAFRHA